MGNCQAAGDVVGISIQLPDGKTERLLWSVAARQVMLQYPGHYVALLPPPIPVPRKPDESGIRPSSKLKLLPPHGMLQVGHHYRLISFEDVLSELSDKKRFGGRMGSSGAKSKRVHSERLPCAEDDDDENLEPNADEDLAKRFEGQLASRGFETMRSFGRSGQWRPALQSISEIGR